MNSIKKKAIITAIALVLILVAIFLVIKNREVGNDTKNGIDVDFGIVDTLNEGKYKIEKNAGEYVDKKGRFFFSYPKEFTIGNFTDEIGETILVQKNDDNVGFQIYISHFDEPGKNITVDRVKEEIPDIEVIDPRPVTINGENIGISFIYNTNVDSDNESREIWIAKNGYLYQMTTYKSEQALLKEILRTWKFLTE